MHIRTEANKSSKIEGTKTSIEEDLMSASEIAPEKRDDHEEVQNYIKAMNHGIDRITIDNFPLCNRLICEIHQVLLQGVRGKHKTPGEMRKSQNWIGGSKPSDAVYVPPSKLDLPELMSDLEKFINNDTANIPHLIKVALAHYQFETIHPFLDGNGRIGRLIIPLYLLEKNILDKPCFYISDYFETRRTEYYAALNNVRIHNDLEQWIIFFLNAVVHTAKTAKNKFKMVSQYVIELNKLSYSIKGRPENVNKIIESFYDQPIQSSNEIIESTELSRSAVDNIVRSLLDNNVLAEITGYTRNRIFIMHRYLGIFQH